MTIEDIKDFLLNKVDNTKFIDSIIHSVINNHKNCWKCELNNLTLYFNENDSFITVIIASKYSTFYFVNSKEDLEYIKEVKLASTQLETMYKVHIVHTTKNRHSFIVDKAMNQEKEDV